MTASVTSGITWWAQSTPDRAAIVFDGHDTVDYQTLERWTDNAAQHLAKHGVVQGDRIGVVGVNSLEWCVAAIGALKLGAVVVPFNNRFTAPEIGHLVDDSEPVLVVSDEGSLAGVSDALVDRDITVAALQEFTALRHQDHRPVAPPPVKFDDVAIIVYTSGSTAAPKGVMYTHRSMFSFMAELAFHEPALRAGGRMIYTLSMSGAPGLPWHVLGALTRGMTLFYEARFDAKVALHRLTSEHIEVMSGVPVQFEQIAALPDFADADLSAMRLVTIAGARVAVATIKAWQDKGVLLRQAYGMTELSGVSTINPVSETLRRPESIGRGSAFTRLRVVRPDGTDCGSEERGEIIVSGPSIAPGYWRNTAAYTEALRDGWFHTGDVGVKDDEGYIRVVDRMKDLIISGGYNIAPSEIESVINEVAGVVEVCVIAAKDEKFGETPAAIVYGPPPDAIAVILELCGQRLAGYKVPRYVIIEPEPLPRMASGKIARREIRATYADVAASHLKVR